jgi:hypothetical protein
MLVGLTITLVVYCATLASVAGSVDGVEKEEEEGVEGCGFILQKCVNGAHSYLLCILEAN